VNDLDTRLERLADEATRHAVPPELDTVARRGRRRRRRRLAGTTLLVAAVVAAGLVLPASLRSGPAPDGPVTAPATDVTGAGMLGGYWFGKADASVFLEQDIDPARREAVLRRIQALDVVDQVYYESTQDAYARFKEQYRTKLELLRRTDPAVVPESYRVRLDAPDHFKRLYRALCPTDEDAPGKPRCMDGVDSVLEEQALLKPVLVGKPWLTTSDVTILLRPGTSDAEREAVRARLEAIDGVARVVYESPAQAFRLLPEKFRSDSGLLPKLTPSSVPACFRVTLRDPTRVEAFHRALCGSRRTGDCPAGLVVLAHARKEGQAAGAGSVRVRP
jgi:cell division protein FtsX